MNEKPNLLIIDYCAEDRGTLTDYLKDDYQIVYAESSAEAVKELENRIGKYRLVLLKVDIPGDQEYDILEYIKDKNLFEEIPIVVTTQDSSKETVIKAYSMGALGVFVKPFDESIVKKRVNNILNLYRHGYRDSVTGGYNRRGFIKETEHFLSTVEKRSDYSVLYFNIRDFKAINEMFGTEGGDFLLRLFYNEVRKSHLAPVYTCRLDADHFACIAETKNIDLKRFHIRLEETIVFEDKRVRMFAVCGIYHLPEEWIPVSKMLDRARLARQTILDESVKPYAIYNESMQSSYFEQAEVLSEFSDSIENHEFEVYFQPVVDAQTERIVSAEALVRWNHPEKGAISPGVFIPTLEKRGHISRLDKYVLNQVDAIIRETERKNELFVPISINLSWMDFYDQMMIDEIVESLYDGTIAGDRIRIEITETSYAALKQNRINLVDNFRMFGAVVLLDDFGSGYSSFGMMRNYNFDIIKIDMSFVQQIEKEPKSRIIIKGIVDMSHQMGLKVVAEGAETAEQVQFLQETGCDYIQGFYFSRPLAKEAFLEYVQKNK